jgi:hypothetical protein
MTGVAVAVVDDVFVVGGGSMDGSVNIRVRSFNIHPGKYVSGIGWKALI